MATKKHAGKYAAQTRNILNWEKKQWLAARLSDNGWVRMEGFVLGFVSMLVIAFIVFGLSK